MCLAELQGPAGEWDEQSIEQALFEAFYGFDEVQRKEAWLGEAGGEQKDKEYRVCRWDPAWKNNWNDKWGGCCCTCVCVVGTKLITANAGDCRALFIHDDKVEALSADHTPFSDYARLKAVAESRPDLMRNEKGEEMFKVYGSPEEQTPGKYLPIVQGFGHRAKVLSTIGVARGFGDFTTSKFQGFYVKPFLSPVPDVTVRDLGLAMEGGMTKTGLLVLGCDGIWDGLSTTVDEAEQNQRAREIVTTALAESTGNDTLQDQCDRAAQACVSVARDGSKDDLTALVVALQTIVPEPVENAQ